jgi:hypothetical protein
MALGIPDQLSVELTLSLARGLALALEKRTQERTAERAAYEARIASKQATHEARIQSLEDKVTFYEATFSTPPEGYIENDGHYPSLVIPVGNGSFRPAKWIKQLDSGKVAMFTAEDGPSSSPYIAEVYATPGYAIATPSEPMPSWFHQLLIGNSAKYNTLRDAIANLDDWGILADVARYRQLEDDIASAYAEMELVHTHIDALRQARQLAQARLEACQVHKQVGHLETLAMGHPSQRTCGGWRTTKKPRFPAERVLSA